MKNGKFMQNEPLNDLSLINSVENDNIDPPQALSLNNDVNDVVEEEIPREFICPITQDIMEKPMHADDGHTYEEVAIRQWFEENDTSPMTRQLSSKELTPNYALKSLIEEYKKKQAKANQMKRQQYYKNAPLPLASSPSFFNNNQNCGKLLAKETYQFVLGMIDFLHGQGVDNELNASCLFVGKFIETLTQTTDPTTLENALKNVGANEETLNFIAFHHSRHPDLNYAQNNVNFSQSLVQALSRKNLNSIREKAGLNHNPDGKGPKGGFSWFGFRKS